MTPPAIAPALLPLFVVVDPLVAACSSPPGRQDVEGQLSQVWMEREQV
jgi:hypothetical protein